MLQKKILPVYLLFSFTCFIAWGQLNLPAETTKWVISKSSSLRVNGTTNVNQFSCEIAAWGQADTLEMCKINKQVILTGRVNLHIRSFDCNNTMMTRDLRKTLKEKQFPLLEISFLTLNEFPDLTTDPQPITGVVDIELAGTSKRFEINYEVSVDAEKTIHLLGYRDMKFSDFNLTPPKRLSGMVRTKDKLSVAFHLKMKLME